MSQRYTVVIAKSYEEAIKVSPLFVGQKAHVSRVLTCANSDGTWTILAEFEIDEEKVSDL